MFRVTLWKKLQDGVRDGSGFSKPTIYFKLNAIIDLILFVFRFEARMGLVIEWLDHNFFHTMRIVAVAAMRFIMRRPYAIRQQYATVVTFLYATGFPARLADIQESLLVTGSLLEFSAALAHIKMV